MWLRRLFHRHFFTTWGMPYVDNLTATCHQIRACQTCGLIQERYIGNHRVVSAYVDLFDRTVH